jgi:hypothetical protein
MWLYDPTVLYRVYSKAVRDNDLRPAQHKADFLVWEEGVPVHKFMYMQMS